MTDFPNFDEIENYEMGRMSEAQRLSFEARLASDNDLQKELSLFRQVVSAVKNHSEDSLRKEFSNADKRLDSGNVSRYMVPLLVAASVVVILLLGTFLFRSNDVEDLADKYHKDPGLPVLMNSTTKSRFDDIMNAYKTGEIEEATILINQIPYSDTVEYYLGVFEFEKENFYVAENHFKKVLENKVSAFNRQSAYRLILTALEMNNKTLAKQRAEAVIADSLNPYRNDALILLDHLK